MENNGNLLSQSISANVGPTFNQTYQYDQLNRLSTATETGNWSQTYSHDTTGNRAASGYVPNPDWTPTSTSQFTTNNQWIRGTGDHYDASGNQLSIAMAAAPNAVSIAFTYDAENRMITANSANTGVVAYEYDGDGRRVRKTVGSVTTTYVYDAMGQLTAEYGAPPTDSGTTYLTADHLGSTRFVSASDGSLKKCYDYLPFGEELQQGMGGRGSCYPANVTNPYPGAPDAESMKFTGQERDAETGLDYFGARYFSGPQGRFTNPDKPLLDQFENDPQSWNLYSYVRNNPLTFTDPNGEDCIYKNNFSSDGTISVERGNCSKKGGDFVDGTIDVNSITYNARRNELGYNFANDAAGTGGAGILDLPARQQGELSPYGQRFYNEMSARRDASNQFIVTFIVSSVVVGTTGGAIASLSGATSGSGLTTLGLRSGHGAFRLALRGLTEADITVTRTGSVLRQADGAKVFIKGIGGGRFNVIVEGEHGVVTAFKNISQKSLERLATNYGWK